LHPAVAQAAEHQAAQCVRVLPSVRLVLGVLGDATAHHDLYLVERVAASGGTGTFRRAESSITIELA
jgi:hypothetical protein